MILKWFLFGLSWALCFCASHLILAPCAWAKPPSEAEFLAASDIAEEVADWVEKLDPKPSAIGIFFIHANPPLEVAYASVFEKEVSRVISERAISLILCNECQTPRVEVIEDRLVVKKGAPDLEALKSLAKKYQVDAFLSVDLFRTKMNVIAQANIYQAATAQLISARSFRSPALDWSESALQVLLTAGPGTASASGSAASKDSTAGAFNIMVLEEIGFGKGGLTVGSAWYSSYYLSYILPTIGWRGRFKTGNLYTLKSLALGFGSSNGSTGGIAARAAYDLFIGSFTNVGIEAVGLAPIRGSSTTSDEYMRSYIGVHIGISIGR